MRDRSNNLQENSEFYLMPIHSKSVREILLRSILKIA